MFDSNNFDSKCFDSKRFESKCFDSKCFDSKCFYSNDYYSNTLILMLIQTTLILKFDSDIFEFNIWFDSKAFAI